MHLELSYRKTYKGDIFLAGTVCVYRVSQKYVLKICERVPG